MGMASVGWVTCCRNSLEQSQGSHADGKKYHKLCSDLCTSPALSGPAQPWDATRCQHMLGFRVKCLQHLLQLGIVHQNGKCRGLGRKPTWPGLSSKALCQRYDAKSWGLWQGRRRLAKRCLTHLQWGEQATVAESQWEGEWQRWFWANKGEQSFLMTGDQ